MRAGAAASLRIPHLRSFATGADPYAFGGTAAEPQKIAKEQDTEDNSRKARRLREKQAAHEERQRVLFAQEVAALNARIGEGLGDDAMVRAVTDASAELGVNNAKLALLGKQLIGLFVMEHIMAQYPKLPSLCTRDIFAYVTGPVTMATVARKLGMQNVVRTAEETPGEEEVVRAFAAVVATIHQDKGAVRARQFVRDTLLAHMRTLDIREKIQFDKPEIMLVKLLTEQGRAMPIYRLVNEAGRTSHQPTFVVGVFSDNKLLGKGAGVSLRLAERDAVRAALLEELAVTAPVNTVPSDLEGL